jgi:hypothetical protein
MKLWYEVVSSQWSTPTAPARTVTVSVPMRLSKAQSDAVSASVQYGNAAIYEMPGGHIIAEYKHGEVTHAETGAER